MFETFNKKVKAFVVGFGAIPKSYREGINNDDSLYTLGIRSKGKEIINNKLSWLKTLGCASLAIPVVGGIASIIKLSAQHGYELILPACATAVGLTVFAIIHSLRKK